MTMICVSIIVQTTLETVNKTELHFYSILWTSRATSTRQTMYFAEV